LNDLDSQRIKEIAQSVINSISFYNPLKFEFYIKGLKSGYLKFPYFPLFFEIDEDPMVEFHKFQFILFKFIFRTNQIINLRIKEKPKAKLKEIYLTKSESAYLRETWRNKE
jgi:hypothetical protein